jgi:hypothetical protein
MLWWLSLLVTSDLGPVMQDPAAVNLRSPLLSVTWCNTPNYTSDAACGEAVPYRKQRNFDGCALTSLLMNDTSVSLAELRGILDDQVLDIVLMPAEDETLWLQDEFGQYYFGGIVGDALADLAERGGEFLWGRNTHTVLSALLMTDELREPALEPADYPP